MRWRTMWNREEAHWCSGVALLPLALGTLNLCNVWWSQKTIKEFWTETYSRVFSSHWSNIQIICQKAPENELEESILMCPAMSLDLNPIEHLWKELNFAVGKNHPASLRELDNSLFKMSWSVKISEWQNVLECSYYQQRLCYKVLG